VSGEAEKLLKAQLNFEGAALSASAIFRVYLSCMSVMMPAHGQIYHHHELPNWDGID
jgi:hypothetical protein